MDIKGKVIEVVAQVCEVENKVITETSTIGDFPQWDSVGHLTILASIEDVFEINFEPEEMMDIEDVKDIIEAVNKKLK